MTDRVRRRAATYTVDLSLREDPRYYFVPADRSSGPVKQRRKVKAIVDIAEDGTLAGVELIDDMPPPPR